MPFIPTVIERHETSLRSMDLFSKMLDDRIIMIHEPITAPLMATITSQLLYLDAVNNEPIQIYISSPGGEVMSGMAILDIMNVVKSPIHTYALGLVASMATILFVHGQKRVMMPNAQIMIHQPLGGAQGQASDIEITAQQILKIKLQLNTMLSACSNQDLEVIKNVTDRDRYFDAKESVEFGLADEIYEG